MAPSWHVPLPVLTGPTWKPPSGGFQLLRVEVAVAKPLAGTAASAPAELREVRLARVRDGRVGHHVHERREPALERPRQRRREVLRPLDELAVASERRDDL